MPTSFCHQPLQIWTNEHVNKMAVTEDREAQQHGIPMCRNLASRCRLWLSSSLTMSSHGYGTTLRSTDCLMASWPHCASSILGKTVVRSHWIAAYYHLWVCLFCHRGLTQHHSLLNDYLESIVMRFHLNLVKQGDFTLEEMWGYPHRYSLLQKIIRVIQERNFFLMMC